MAKKTKTRPKPSAKPVKPVETNKAEANKTDVTEAETKTAEIPYVVGLLYDVDAIMTQFILDRVATTPLEAAKLMRNTIWHIRKNYIYDATENIVLFVMEDPAGDGE